MSDASDPSPATPADGAGPTSGGATRLLVVEDEFLIRLMLSEALLDAGYEVLEAADADEALRQIELAAGRPPRALLTDVQLPGPVNGHELASRIRARLPALPVIFMTGRPEPLGAPASRRDVVIAKPYLPSEVCAAVERLLSE